jgi:hypothetical protein
MGRRHGGAGGHVGREQADRLLHAVQGSLRMQPVFGRVGVSRARKGEAMIEQIEWFRVDEQMPDAGVTVLVHAPEASEPVYYAYWDDQFSEWNYDSGAPMRHTPTHWAEVPKGPTQ